MATLFKTNGEVLEVKPENGKSFTYKELQDFVKTPDSDMIQIVPLRTEGMSMVCNEEGKLEPGTCMPNTPKNPKAEEMWEKEYPIAEFPNNNDQCICGDVLVATELEMS